MVLKNSYVMYMLTIKPIRLILYFYKSALNLQEFILWRKMLHDRDYVNFVFKEIKKTFWKIKGKFKVYQFIAMVKPWCTV